MGGYRLVPNDLTRQVPINRVQRWMRTMVVYSLVLRRRDKVVYYVMELLPVKMIPLVQTCSGTHAPVIITGPTQFTRGYFHVMWCMTDEDDWPICTRVSRHRQRT